MENLKFHFNFLGERCSPPPALFLSPTWPTAEQDELHRSFSDQPEMAVTGKARKDTRRKTYKAFWPLSAVCWRDDGLCHFSPAAETGQKVCRNSNAALVFGPEPGCFLNSALRASIRICLARPASSCWITFYGKKCALTVIGQWGGVVGVGGGGGGNSCICWGLQADYQAMKFEVFVFSFYASMSFSFLPLSPILFFVHLWLKNNFPGCCFLPFFLFSFFCTGREHTSTSGNKPNGEFGFSYSLTLRRDELGEKLLSDTRLTVGEAYRNFLSNPPPPFGVEFCHLWPFCIMAQKR